MCTMEKFDDLHNVWGNQSDSKPAISASDLIKKGEAHRKKLKASQFWTIGILSALIIILVGYFIWMGVHKLNGFTIGLAIMICVIIMRVTLEWISVIKFNAIKPDTSLKEFSNKMQQFYSWRKRIHWIFIPIIYILYIVGFTMMLPSFKENLSQGMYVYVIISGYGSLIVFALFIIRFIKREVQLLDYLKKCN